MTTDSGAASPDPGAGYDAWSAALTSRRLVSGGVWSLLTGGLALFLGLPLSVALVRLMPTSQYGGFALAVAISGLITPLLGAGLAASVASAGAAAASDSAAALAAVARAAVRVVGVTTLGAFTLVGGISLVLARSSSLRPALTPFLVLAPAMLLIPIKEASAGMLQAVFDPVRPFLAALAGSVVVGGITGAGLATGHRSALVMAAARCAGLSIGAVLLATGADWRSPDNKQDGSGMGARPLLAFGAVLLLSSSLSQAFSYLDVVFLGSIKGAVAVAAYAPVSTLAASFTAISAVLGAYVLPALSAAIARGELAQAGHLYRWASRWAATAAGPSAMVLFVVPHPLLKLLFGGPSAALVTPARILGVGTLVNIAFGYNWIVLAAAGRRRAIALASVFGLAISVAACVVLIPQWGAIGAAWATSVSLIATNLAVSTHLFLQEHVMPIDRPFILTLLALVSGGLATSLAGSAVPGGPLAQVVVAALVISVPTLAVSLIGGGTVDRQLGADLLNNVFARIRR